MPLKTKSSIPAPQSVNRRMWLSGSLLGAFGAIVGLQSVFGASSSKTSGAFAVQRSDAEWRKLLSDGQYYVLRQHGTERAFTSPLNDEKRAGVFQCAGCALPLFASAHKFDSGTGWPSFWQPVMPEAVGTTTDTSFFMERVEVHCARCGGHMGHVFDDGPPPTGKRYCINGVALTFSLTKV